MNSPQEAAFGSASPRPVGQAPTRVLMTLDAVGGVWRYAMDLASSLGEEGFEFVFIGLGPQPSRRQEAEAEPLGTLRWLDAPLDWTTDEEGDLDTLAPQLAELVESEEIDIVHLNAPSQAAGLKLPVPIVAVSHSCVVTWFAAVRGTGMPRDWLWQERRNRAGFDAADAVIAPSNAHAAMLRDCYGPIAGLEVVYNGARPAPASLEKSDFVFAAGRWWDDGKNGAVLDRAATSCAWPVVMAGANRGPKGQHLEIVNADHRGELAHSEARALMGRAGIVCSPSIYEPFGLVPLEAAGVRAALVLADIPTYRELWDGAAVFADPRDPGAFAAAIDALAGDPERRHRLAEAAFIRSRAYSLAAQAEATATVDRRLLAGRLLVRSA
ncbi:glycosyl transferase [Devosia geojensis]|uniref:Glycosyl transferase n=1 Tax=Devosia geojensis TaxID=443610 RepID=A0A0F5FVH5_9HYPH|nr:glycosyltransferase family 4 protein [Devosia geojensis]KKB12550.1 glycosyl transferase [Devosia geojensis]